MTENNHDKNKPMKEQVVAKRREEGTDVSFVFLSNALKMSFAVLKVIMVLLVLAFLASGIKPVGPDERAIILRFGKIRPVGEDVSVGEGWYLTLPYPIEEMVRVPVTRKVTLDIKNFWYYQGREELSGGKAPPPGRTLRPESDGYCLTRSESNPGQASVVGGEDYGIVHCKWQLVYQIDENKVEQFFRNVYIDQIGPGEDYFDVITKSIRPMLESMVSDAIVATMVNYTIDEALTSESADISRNVRTRLQASLDSINSGIKVDSVPLTVMTWPRQVNPVFEYAMAVSQTSEQTITEAQSYAMETLNEVGGEEAENVLRTFKNPSATEEEKDKQLSKLAGAAREKIAKARAYKTQVVENARANAGYLKEILPEYRKRPELVIQTIYQDAIEQVMNNADEKMVMIPPTKAKDHEIRVLLNRDVMLKPKKQSNENEKNKE